MSVLFVVYCVFVMRSGYIKRHLHVETNFLATTQQKITVDKRMGHIVFFLHGII